MMESRPDVRGAMLLESRGPKENRPLESAAGVLEETPKGARTVFIALNLPERCGVSHYPRGAPCLTGVRNIVVRHFSRLIRV
jgi:hypothetical protein